MKEDLKIRIPEEIFGIKKWECEVVSNYNVSTFIKEFVVKLPEGQTLDFQAGGYIQIDVPVCDLGYDTIDIMPHPDLESIPEEIYKKDWDHFKMWESCG